MGPLGDALFLRRAGLVNVLRELKGLDWDAALTETGRLAFWWPRGRLVVNLLGSMDGERSYPMVVPKTAFRDKVYHKKHNFTAAIVVEQDA